MPFEDCSGRWRTPRPRTPSWSTTLRNVSLVGPSTMRLQFAARQPRSGRIYPPRTESAWFFAAPERGSVHSRDINRILMTSASCNGQGSSCADANRTLAGPQRNVGDFDSSGEDIARDFVARTDCWIHTERVALTVDQVAEFNPPPQPGKTTDSRAATFTLVHGAWCRSRSTPSSPPTSTASSTSRSPAGGIPTPTKQSSKPSNATEISSTGGDQRPAPGRGPFQLPTPSSFRWCLPPGGSSPKPSDTTLECPDSEAACELCFDSDSPRCHHRCGTQSDTAVRNARWMTSTAGGRKKTGTLGVTATTMTGECEPRSTNPSTTSSGPTAAAPTCGTTRAAPGTPHRDRTGSSPAGGMCSAAAAAKRNDRPARETPRSAYTQPIRQHLQDMPAPIVADTLGYHPVTTTKLANQAGTTWSRYAPGDHSPLQPQEARDS